MVKTNKTNTTSPSMGLKPFIASKPVLGVRIGHNFQSLVMDDSFIPKKIATKLPTPTQIGLLPRFPLRSHQPSPS